MEKPENKKAIEQHLLILRTLEISDYEAIKDIMKVVYADAGGAWTKREFKNQLSVFPEGQVGIEVDGKIVAAALSLIVDYSKFGDTHTYDQITGEGKFNTHDYNGDTLYGTDLFVDPEYRDMRLGRRLYDARKEMCENLNLRAIIVGGRIPGYRKYRDTLTPRQYLEEVKNKEIYDPVLTFQLANDFHVRKLLPRYSYEDKSSMHYATLLEWINIAHEEETESLIGGTKSIVRLGAVQWQMRPVESLDDLLQQMEFFVDTVSSYAADFVVFPEFFNAPLMALAQDVESASDAVRQLAEYTEPVREKMQELAISYNINIIAGSMPVYEDHKLYNVSFLLHRDGNMDSQYKLHITPDEQSYWGLQGGHDVRVFDTDAGRVGVLVCYDVEFPELSRILADQKMDILFVPYWTDTKNAYLRVRRCAQARAIENECYVVITGSVGNLPRVENMDIQYSQSAVFSPSDFSFPHDAVVAEATPNTETTLITDLDLELLKKLRTQGSVRNLQQRRKDLYEVLLKKTKKKEKEVTPPLVEVQI
uniref:Bifunctional GNAT family N-acetyltransferase/carbon-nitrogen hydrolase family protein n=1 Tax=Roseihalotalea indica TaxID=2867963 RepID=A0AA49JGY5_9BACT|nr:bifunctional GNAT family N-acetyltransferase/carbon-nitrogen hydrolase family protein [Tunicatimonas sp. TK19036]